MDTSDPLIKFDEKGRCNHCTEASTRIKEQLLPADERKIMLEQLVDTIKKEGKGKDYDCIIGVSGGVDSSTVACYVKELGLRPLAVHFDNGWNSELAVDNIKKVLQALDIDLYTHVVDWEEFRDLQLSFLRASVANCEVPTDHGINALLFHMARKEKTRFVLGGGNVVTESIMPISWGYYNQDLRNLRAIHRRFGAAPLRTMPKISITQYICYVLVKRMKQIPFLNYVDYNKENAKRMLVQKYGWRDYGGKHYESVWTRFFQAYYLPEKFGFDKRKAHLSSMICSGQIDREQALEEIQKPLYDNDLLRQDKEFVMKKFGLSTEEFENIMKAAPRQATEFASNYFLFETLKKYKNMFRKIATSA
jgi:N-acetyl sugar amidotransferase